MRWRLAVRHQPLPAASAHNLTNAWNGRHSGGGEQRPTAPRHGRHPGRRRCDECARARAATGTGGRTGAAASFSGRSAAFTRYRRRRRRRSTVSEQGRPSEPARCDDGPASGEQMRRGIATEYVVVFFPQSLVLCGVALISVGIDVAFGYHTMCTRHHLGRRRGKIPCFWHARAIWGDLPSPPRG